MGHHAEGRKRDYSHVDNSRSYPDDTESECILRTESIKGLILYSVHNFKNDIIYHTVKPSK